jgi:hypothetical protein
MWSVATTALIALLSYHYLCEFRFRVDKGVESTPADRKTFRLTISWLVFSGTISVLVKFFFFAIFILILVTFQGYPHGWFISFPFPPD